MAHFLPDHSYYQTPQSSAIHHNTPTHPHRPGQDCRFSLDTLSRDNVETTVSLDQYNVDRTGTLGFHKKTNTYSLKTETLRRSNSSSIGVSQHSIPTTMSGHPVPGPAVHNGGDTQGSISTYGSASNVTASNTMRLLEDTLRQQLVAAVYGNFPEPPELFHGRNVPIDATPIDGVHPKASGKPTYLAAGSRNVNPANDRYTPHPSQPFFSQSNANSLGPPQDYDPSKHSAPHPLFPNISPNHLGPPSISATCYTSSIDLPIPNGNSFNGLECADLSSHFQHSNTHRSSPNKSNPHHPKPSDIPTPSHSSARRCSKSNTRQYNTPGSLDSLAIRQLALKAGKAKPIQRSKKHNRRRLDSRVKIPTNFDPSDNSDHSHLVRNKADSDTFDFSGTLIQDPFELFTTHYHPENDTDECKVADSPIAPKAGFPTNLDPQDTFDNSDSLRSKTNLDTFYLSGTSIQGLVDSIINQYHSDNDTEESEVADEPSAPNVDSSGVPHAGSLHVRQFFAGHPVGDVGAVEVPRSQRKLVQHKEDLRSERAKNERQHCYDPQYSANEYVIHDFASLNVPNVDKSHFKNVLEPDIKHCSTGQSVGDPDYRGARQPQLNKECHKKQQIQRVVTERRRSTRGRRANPLKRYFCLIPDCNCSREKDFNGYASIFDLRRHWLSCHEERKYLCDFFHKIAPSKFGRKDNLKEWVPPIASHLYFKKVN